MVEERAPVGLMYRERPFSGRDSGWRFFAGDEDGAFAADPRNILMVPLADIERNHPAVAARLDAPVGAAFEAGDVGRWVKGEDIDASD